MPTQKGQFDFVLGGKGYMLARQKNRSGRDVDARSWARTGSSDAPERRSATDVQFGELPGEEEFVEVWEDFSGGFGNAYRDPAEPNAIHWSENMDTRWPGQAVHCQQLAPFAAASGMFNINFLIDVPYTGDDSAPPPRAVLAIGQNFTRRFQPLGPPGTDTAAFGSTLELAGVAGGPVWHSRPALFGSFTYIPRHDSGNFYRRGHDGTYTQAPLAGRMFAVAGNQLWRMHGPASGERTLIQNVAAGADPMSAANWSATLHVGDGQTNFSDIAVLGDQVFLGGPKGLYAGDASGTFYNVLSDLEYQAHEDNCRDLAIHNNQVIAPHVAGLFAYRPSDFQAEVLEIGPRQSSRSPVRGYPRAARALGQWVYGGWWTGSQSYILAGRDDPNRGGYVWNVMQRLPHTAKISRIHFDGIATASGGLKPIPNRMWVVTDMTINTGGTAPLYVLPIPRGYGNPLGTDPTFTPNYTGSARMDLGRSDRGAPATPKVFKMVEVRTDASSLTGTPAIQMGTINAQAQWIEVWYSLDGGSFNYLDTAATSPLSVLFFPHGEGSFITAQDIELSLRSFTASTNQCPVIRSVAVRGALIARSVDRVTAQVRIADGLADRHGTPMRDAATMLRELREMHKTPRVLVDPTGGVSYVNVSPVVEEQEVWQEGDTFELMATVRMGILEYSAR